MHMCMSEHLVLGVRQLPFVSLKAGISEVIVAEREAQSVSAVWQGTVYCF